LPLVGLVVIAAAGCGATQDPNLLPVFPAQGKLSFHGKVPEGAYVALYPKANVAKAPNGQPVVPRGQVQGDGSFNLTSYAAGDGAPVGDYAVTVEWHKTITLPSGVPNLGPNLLPAKYSKAETSPVTVQIAQGKNELPAIILK
jgi:hypothetical protein